VTFINDTYPRATNGDGTVQSDADWSVQSTLVKRGASIGSGATILANVVIGERAIIGAGSVVTKDVPAKAIVAGNPATVLRYIEDSCDPMTEGVQLNVESIEGHAASSLPSEEKSLR
jgi:Acetyltransferase (isoleucine patch superfamily)